MNATRFTMTIPREKVSDKALDDKHWIGEIESSLTRIFGGFTSTEGRGGWLSPSDNIVYEPVIVFTMDVQHFAGGPDNKVVDLSIRLRRYAEWLAWKLDEEAIYVTQHEGVHTWLVEAK